MTDRINEMETEMNRLKESEENARKMHEKVKAKQMQRRKKLHPYVKIYQKFFVYVKQKLWMILLK